LFFRLNATSHATVALTLGIYFLKKQLKKQKKVIDKPISIRYTVKVRYKKWLGDGAEPECFFYPEIQQNCLIN